MDSDNNIFDISTFPFITQVRLASCISEDSGARIFIQKGLEPILQTGPTCGLVALSNSLEYFGVDAQIEEILEEAVMRKYTKQGEMFSAYDLSDLTNHFLPNSSKVQDFPTPSELAEQLLNGSQFLVAYDCDKNFGPGKFNGHKSHWLLLCGFLHTDSSINGFIEATTSDSFQYSEDLFLLGYQGKSRSLGIFKYIELKESNAQLFEAGPVRGTDEYEIKDVNDLSNIRGKVIQICNDSNDK